MSNVMGRAQSCPTPYPELNTVLRELVRSVQEILGATFVGAYLQGSFAVGDFDVHSDVDFIIVVEDELSHDQIDALQAMHERIFCIDIPWAQHLEGSYFPRDVIRRPPERGRRLWYLEHGAHSLVEADHCNTLVVRWVVREEGVTLAGPAPKTLVDPISAEALRAEMWNALTGWGREIIANPKPYYSHFYQSFIVLHYCRVLHDLHTGYPGSKRAGAEWAKANLDVSWSALIDRAWDGRPDPYASVRRPPDPEDFEKTLKFVEYAIKESEEFGPNSNQPESDQRSKPGS